MIYFDNSATTPLSEAAFESYQTVIDQYFGNPSSLHALGEVSSKLLKQARISLAQQVGVEADEIFFTSGGTEGDNWVIKGTAFAKQYYGKHIITTKIEHPAVRESMRFLETLGFEVSYLSVDDQGQIDLDELKRTLRQDTILVSIIAVNNEVGSVQLLDSIGDVLKAYPTIHYHVDAVQTVGKIDVPLGVDSRIDMAVFSSHKFHGPRGCGFVYKKKGRTLASLMHGGGQELNERSGTENLPSIVAMSRAFRLIKDSEKQTRPHLVTLNQLLRSGLAQYDHIQIFTPQDAAPHILCFGIRGIRGEVLVHALEAHDIYVSTTSACSSRRAQESSTLIAMGYTHQLAQTAVRISLTETNTEQEVQRFLTVIGMVYNDTSAVHQ